MHDIVSVISAVGYMIEHLINGYMLLVNRYIILCNGYGTVVHGYLMFVNGYVMLVNGNTVYDYLVTLFYAFFIS